MIEILKTGKCADCKHAVLELESYTVYSFTDQVIKYDLKCIHEDVCSEWEQKLDRSKAKKIKGE